MPTVLLGKIEEKKNCDVRFIFALETNIRPAAVDATDDEWRGG